MSETDSEKLDMGASDEAGEEMGGVSEVGDDFTSDPEELSESLGGGEGWTDDLEGGGSASKSPFDALRNSEPHTPIDEVEGFRVNPEYASKYTSRGLQKIVGATETEAWVDLVMGGVCYTLQLFEDPTSGQSDGESNPMEEQADEPVPDGPGVGP